MRSSAVTPLLLTTLLFLTPARPQGRQFLVEPVLEDGSTVEDQLRPPLGHDPMRQPRPGWLEWILNIFLGGSNNKPTTHPPPPAIDQTKCPPCKCGILNKQLRIVGGQATTVNQYPWMCLLLYLDKFYCGATLINDHYVLTASHCVHGFNKNKITVRCYEHDRDTNNETMHFESRVDLVKQHGNWDPSNFDNDIAVLKTKDKFPIMEKGLRPACLPHPKKNFAGATGIVTGWGVKKAGGATSAVLQEVEVPIMTNAECRKSEYGKSRITDNMLCAGYPEGKKDSCQGDSGGPLHVKNDELHHVVGVVSWGEGCARPNHPGVYTRVNRYLTWIEKNTRDACQCRYPEETQGSSTYAPPAPVSTQDPEVDYTPDTDS